MRRKVKRLKLAKWTKMNKLPKMRYFNIPLCPKFEQCAKTKVPLGRKRLKLIQADSDADTSGFVQNLTNKLHRQVEKDSKTDAGTENGFHCGK